MNREQIRYCKKRIDDICRQKIAEVEVEAKKRKKKLTARDKVELVLSKKVKPKKDISTSVSLDSAFDFSEYENFGFTNKEDKQRIADIVKQTTLATDELFLGDETKALQLIRNLENY